MSTLTPNYELIVPDDTDAVAQVRADYAENLRIIDNNLGGGGGSGGHTIIDPNGNSLPQESGLQFTGNVSVTDDNVNGKTVVDILGGGGNVYGAFIDTNRVITSGTYNTSLTYTATEDCFVVAEWVSPQNDSAYFSIDGERAFTNYASSSVDAGTITLPLKKGQVLTGTTAYNSTKSYKVYGVVQGTNGIFTPIIYSDNERMVGVWRDNKPLYKKTYTATITSGSQWIDTGLDSGDEIVLSEGSLYQNNGLILTLASGDSSANAGINIFSVGVVTPSKWACLFRTNNNDARGALTLTLYYTKGSDVAGSGNWNTDGVPTVHYSTSEQVIGTWIDGKPLYQKSVEIGTVNGGSGKNVAHGISDFKRLVGHECVGYNTAESAWNILSKVDNDASYQREFKVNATYVTIGNSANSQTFTDVVATIRYTKTTD